MLRHFIHIVCLLLITGAAHAGEAGRIVLAVGDVLIAGQRVTPGGVVHEGDELATGGGSYAYMKTVDNGFLILRPNSRARVTAYHIDPQDAANTRIKLELLNGVARSISGQAVKQARQNFRFNTPVAAIGVRGTDFTVFTDQQTTRIIVNSGGIVASGFSAACNPAGSGPCEGASSQELFADQAGKLLQINHGQVMLLQRNGLSPDISAPPRSDEPDGKSIGAKAGSLTLAGNGINLDAQKSELLLEANTGELLLEANTGELLLEANTVQTTVTPPVQIVPPRQIIWGRWQPILNQPAGLDIAGIFDAQGQLLAINTYFAILRSSGADLQMPSQGAMGFALTQSEAYIINEPSGAIAPAGLENARLDINFATSAFATGFDLVSQQNERFPFQAQGVVAGDGTLYGNSQFVSPTNMAVSGAVSVENGANAAYIFQGRISNQRLATGVTAWTKN